jgi:hypothetical protein
MPVTSTEYPVLLQFACVVEKSTGAPMNPAAATTPAADGQQDRDTPKTLPKGVVLGKDGKP